MPGRSARRLFRPLNAKRLTPALPARLVTIVLA
jgi:hypothetical protein